MIITKIEQQKRNKDRASIYIDEEYAFGIHADLVYDLNLKKNMEIDQDFIDHILMKEEEKKAHIYAIGLINYRPRCEAEVRKKMSEKGYASEVIEETIDYLTVNDFLNDTRFVKIYIESKLDINKYGPNRIRYQLSHMGIDRMIIDNCLREVEENIGDYQDYSEYEVALSLAKKKTSSMEGLDKAKQYSRLTSFLGRKGYSYDVISRIARELIQ